ncbi:LysR substrate-binding domain-containing protein [Paraburkholderia sp. SIMBA_030]
MARRHPLLHIHTCYSDRVVDLVGEGYDCAIRIGYLQDSNLIAKRVGPIDNAIAIAAAAVAGLGLAWLPDGVKDQYIASGALVPVMCRFPPPTAGIYVVRPPGQNPPAKIRVLTEMLIECFDQHAYVA